MKKAILFLVVFAFGFAVKATTVTAVAPGGDWNDAGTWDGPPPGCYDTILIPVGTTVTVTNTEDLEACGPIIMIVEGTLYFQTGKKLKFPCNSAGIITPTGYMGVGGGGGSSTYLTICTVEVWNAAGGDIDGSVDGYTYLPIELIDFNAELFHRSTYVTWTTKSEASNDYFTVQRSSDGSSWENLGTVDGAGTSSITLDYTFVDESPLLGLNYYRLKQTNYNGLSAVFDPVVVNNNGVQYDNETLIFPNPAGGNQVTLFLSDYQEDLVHVQVIGMNGRIVVDEDITVTDGGLAVIYFNRPPAAGMYSLKINAELEKLVWH